MRFRWMVFGMVLLTVACVFDTITGPYQGAIPYTPPAWVQEEWEIVWRDCGSKVLPSDRPLRAFETVRWFTVPLGQLRTADGRVAWGVTISNGRIFITKPYVRNVLVLRHEMLHAQGVLTHDPIFQICELDPNLPSQYNYDRPN